MFCYKIYLFIYLYTSELWNIDRDRLKLTVGYHRIDEDKESFVLDVLQNIDFDKDVVLIVKDMGPQVTYKQSNQIEYAGPILFTFILMCFQ